MPAIPDERTTRVNAVLDEIAPPSPAGVPVRELPAGRLRREATEMWLFNPTQAFRQACQLGVGRFIVYLGMNFEQRATCLRYLRTWGSMDGNTQYMICDARYGSSLYNGLTPFNRPVAVYPTWSARSGRRADLLRLLENPVGEDRQACSNSAIAPEFRPVYGQRHKVIIQDLPLPFGSDIHMQAHREVVTELAGIQERHPQAEILPLGMGDYAAVFGGRFKSSALSLPGMSMEGRAPPEQRFIVLPNGAIVGTLDKRKLMNFADWIETLGYSAKKFINDEDPVKHHEFNIRSAQWAQRFWTLASPFSLRRKSYRPAQINRFVLSHHGAMTLPAARKVAAKVLGDNAAKLDQLFCNTCMLFAACPLARINEVCGVEGSVTVGLADDLGSRDPNKIMNGLSGLLRLNAKRAEEAAREEEFDNEIATKDVTALINSVFQQGIAMARLVTAVSEPAKGVNVNVFNAAPGALTRIEEQILPSLQGASPRDVAARLSSELASFGIPPEQITPDLIKEVMRFYAKHGEGATRDKLGVAIRTYMDTTLAENVKQIEAQTGEQPAPTMAKLVETDSHVQVKDKQRKLALKKSEFLPKTGHLTGQAPPPNPATVIREHINWAETQPKPDFSRPENYISAEEDDEIPF